MRRSKQDWHRWILFLVYFGFFSWFIQPQIMNLAAWWLGGLLSFLFSYMDRFLYVYVTKPELALSQAVRNLIKHKHYKAALRLLTIRGSEQTRLIGQSVIFMMAFIPMGLYVLSSTGSYAAAGLLLGIGLHLIVDLIYLGKDIDNIKGMLFWPIKRDITHGETYFVLGIYGLAFFGFSLAMIR